MKEPADVVAFMRALHGDDVDPTVADPNRMPPSLSGRRG
jgi:hypothetical protein